MIEKFHVPNNTKCLMSRTDDVLGDEGVRVRCKGEHSKRIMFSVNFYPKDFW